MRSPVPIEDVSAAVANMGAALSDAVTPTIKLGVTGLSRAGKTVFTTALVRCLTGGGADPAFLRLHGIEGFRAFLEPQPNDDLPRFSYEDHLAKLIGQDPEWPQSTRQISQLRLTLEWRRVSARDRLRRLDLTQRLHIDIIDYPGEWLSDLSLLDQSYSKWSQDTLSAIRSRENPQQMDASGSFLAFLPDVDPQALADEQLVISGAKVYTKYLHDMRRLRKGGVVDGPGRFLMPGDLQGSPLLTFFPVRCDGGAHFKAGTFGDLMRRRFESYKSNVVVPFFKNHFSKLDRQIVLIDVLGALNGGAEALIDMEHELAGVLDAFRPGRNTWLSRFFTRKIDKIVFAATKADHVHFKGRGRLEAILRQAVDRAFMRAEREQAQLSCLAIAALRATEDVERKSNGDVLPCIRGIPLAGEQLDLRKFDGKTSAVVFPGDLPTDPLAAFERESAKASTYDFVRFRPPNSVEGTSSTLMSRWPHINVDMAFQFLVGDYLP